MTWPAMSGSGQATGIGPITTGTSLWPVKSRVTPKVRLLRLIHSSLVNRKRFNEEAPISAPTSIVRATS